VKRALASFWLSLFGFALLLPAFSGGGDSDLPACCRRDGKHHCAMMEITDMAASDASPASPELRSVPPRCPLYLKHEALPVGLETVAAPAVSAIGQQVICDRAWQPVENPRSVILDSSSQKRGPPNPLAS
jgi:hypothetical protein